ncbi:helix-turn-helix domain-containing protein [Actinoplanes sp. NPDC049802]|uniref:helix-turn-helix transcriptional regulator n=1 Tax=Actinoplanes sp. NPDC049802 TaxID=3154742 RepID=UPI0033DB104B
METRWVGPNGGITDTPRHRALGSDSRATILRLIQDSDGGMTASDVAARTGQHLSTTRAHLDRLIDAGLLVKARSSGGLPGRPAWRYRAATADPAPAPYRALTAALLDHLTADGADGRATAGRAGRDWGRRLAEAAHTTGDPVQAVATVLDGLGFAPSVQPGTADGEVVVHLLTCPFLDLVGRNPDAICALHAGLVRGVLDHHRAESGEAVLEPFGAPSACVVRMRAGSPGPAAATP